MDELVNQTSQMWYDKLTRAHISTSSSCGRPSSVGGRRLTVGNSGFGVAVTESSTTVGAESLPDSLFAFASSTLGGSTTATESSLAPAVASGAFKTSSRDPMPTSSSFSAGGEEGVLWVGNGFSLEVSVGSEVTLDGAEEPKMLGSDEDMASGDGNGGARARRQAAQVLQNC